MNIFREFFERHRRHCERVGPQDIPQDILNDLYEPYCNSDQTTKGNDTPDYAFGSSMGFLSEVEDMFDNFFNGHGVVSFPPLKGDEMMSPEENEGVSSVRGKSLQEKMLNNSKKTDQEHKTLKFPFAFGDLRTPEGKCPFGDTIGKEDRDLDEDLRRGEKSLDDILPRGDNQPTIIQSPSSFSFFSSSVSRITNQDGVIETKKTVKDSSGNEEVTITRVIDGKEYTISHKKDEFDNEKKNERSHFGMLGPQKQPTVNDQPSSLLNRLRDWFNDVNG